MKATNRPRSPLKKKASQPFILMKPIVLPTAFPEAIRRTTSEYFNPTDLDMNTPPKKCNENKETFTFLPHLTMNSNERRAKLGSMDRVFQIEKPIALNDKSKHSVDPALQQLYSTKRREKVDQIKAEAIANSLVVPSWPVKKKIAQRKWEELKQSYQNHVRQFQSVLQSLLDSAQTESDVLLTKADTKLQEDKHQCFKCLEKLQLEYHTLSLEEFQLKAHSCKAQMLEACELPFEVQDQLQLCHEHFTKYLADQVDSYYSQTQTLLVPKDFLFSQGTAVALESVDRLLQLYQEGLTRISKLKCFLAQWYEQWAPMMQILHTTWSEAHTHHVLQTFQTDIPNEMIQHLAEQLSSILSHSLTSLPNLDHLTTQIFLEFKKTYESWATQMNHTIKTHVDSSHLDTLAEQLHAKLQLNEKQSWLHSQAEHFFACIEHHWAETQLSKYCEQVISRIFEFQQTEYEQSMHYGQLEVEECISTYHTQLELLKKEKENLKLKLSQCKSEMECIECMQEIKLNSEKIEKGHESQAKEHQRLVTQWYIKHIEKFKEFEKFWTSIDISNDTLPNFILWSEILTDFLDSHVPDTAKQNLPCLPQPTTSMSLTNHCLDVYMKDVQAQLKAQSHQAGLDAWQVAKNCHRLFLQWQGDSLSQLQQDRAFQLRQLTNQVNEQLYFHDLTKEKETQLGHDRLLDLHQQHVQMRKELQSWMHQQFQLHTYCITKFKDIEKSIQSYITELQGVEFFKLTTLTELQQCKRRIINDSTLWLHSCQSQYQHLETKVQQWQQKIRPTSFYTFLEPKLMDTYAFLNGARNEFKKLEFKLLDSSKSILTEVESIMSDVEHTQGISQHITKIKVHIKSELLKFQSDHQSCIEELHRNLKECSFTTCQTLALVVASLYCIMKKTRGEGKRMDFPLPPMTDSIKFFTFEEYLKMLTSSSPSSSSSKSDPLTSSKPFKKKPTSSNTSLIKKNTVDQKDNKNSPNNSSLANYFQCVKILDETFLNLKSLQTFWSLELQPQLLSFPETCPLKKSAHSKYYLCLDTLALHALATHAIQEIEHSLHTFIIQSHKALETLVENILVKFTTLVDATFQDWQYQVKQKCKDLQTQLEMNLDQLVTQVCAQRDAWNAKLKYDFVEGRNQVQLETDTFLASIKTWHQSVQIQCHTLKTEFFYLLSYYLELFAPLTWFFNHSSWSNDVSNTNINAFLLSKFVTASFSNASITNVIWEKFKRSNELLDTSFFQILESMEKKKSFTEMEQLEWKESSELTMNMIQKQYI